MFSTHQLAHEQRRAFDFFQKNLHLCNRSTMVAPSTLTLDNVTDEGNTHFLYGHITPSMLPRLPGWKWNQSRTKISMYDAHNEFNVTFFKLNTRKTNSKSEIKQPRYKIWIFHITNIRYNMKSSFVWCEKGQVLPILDDNLLKDLSFLEQFVSMDQAIEFGWSDSQKALDSSPTSFDFSNTQASTVMVDCSNFSLF
mmetsp:Transcript_18568/g.31628  ORF Transcript_18568/g.31628 Transcript_18568/m.31628 type:complete len:196 (-) Transcript_18568:81-668(-)